MTSSKLHQHNPNGYPEVTFSRSQAIEMLSWRRDDIERLNGLDDRALRLVFRMEFKTTAVQASPRDVALWRGCTINDDVMQLGRVFLVPTLVEVVSGSHPEVDLTKLDLPEYAREALSNQLVGAV
jgi:hypothetical protein